MNTQTAHISHYQYRRDEATQRSKSSVSQEGEHMHQNGRMRVSVLYDKEGFQVFIANITLPSRKSVFHWNKPERETGYRLIRALYEARNLDHAEKIKELENYRALNVENCD